MVSLLKCCLPSYTPVKFYCNCSNLFVLKERDREALIGGEVIGYESFQEQGLCKINTRDSCHQKKRKEKKNAFTQKKKSMLLSLILKGLNFVWQGVWGEHWFWYCKSNFPFSTRTQGQIGERIPSPGVPHFNLLLPSFYDGAGSSHATTTENICPLALQALTKT